jgi:hypothetical protein
MENLDILISGAKATGYQARVINSPHGRTDDGADFPLTSGADGQLSFAGARIPIDLDTVTDAQHTGTALYQALAQDSRIANIVNASLSGSGAVHLRFQVEPKELRRLPWELLYRDPQGFLSLLIAITRFVAVGGQRIRSLLTEPPLKILIVSAAPNGFPALDSAKEIGRIRESLRADIEAGSVKIIERSNIPIDAARDIARDECVHVLHFIGHGAFNNEHPVLAFADADGTGALVTADVFAANLAGIDSLRLVFLNACDSARQSTTTSMVGIAPKLIQRAGLPAVLAMQTRILDSSAIEFSQGFYGELARGGRIDDAAREGRLRIFNRHSLEPRYQREFIVPVLFLRPADAKLIEFPREPIPAVIDGRQRPPVSGWRDRVRLMAQLYTEIDGWKTLHDLLHDLDTTLELVEYEIARTPSNPAALDVLWRNAEATINRLKAFAVNTPVAQTRFAERLNGAVTGDPWVVDIVVASRRFDSARRDRGAASRALRDLRRSVRTHLNTGDSGLSDSAARFPVESIWTDGAPSADLERVTGAVNQKHRTLITAIHLHELLQDLTEAFQQVRAEADGLPAAWDLDDIDRAWEFLRTTILDSRLRPYARANNLLTTDADGNLTGDDWAVELLSAADQFSAALDSALDDDNPVILSEPLRRFDQTLSKTFFMRDESLRALTNELRQLGVELLALA